MDVQVVSRQQRADGQQRYPQGQVEPAAGVVLGLDGIEAHHEHVQQPDRYPQAHPAQQEAHEHLRGPAVCRQDQVDDEQLRVQRREERQAEKRRVHRRSPGVGFAIVSPIATRTWILEAPTAIAHLAVNEPAVTSPGAESPPVTVLRLARARAGGHHLPAGIT